MRGLTFLKISRNLLSIHNNNLSAYAYPFTPTSMTQQGPPVLTYFVLRILRNEDASATHTLSPKKDTGYVSYRHTTFFVFLRAHLTDLPGISTSVYNQCDSHFFFCQVLPWLSPMQISRTWSVLAVLSCPQRLSLNGTVSRRSPAEMVDS